MPVWTKRIDFTLWPVGQGLFTTADLWVGGNFFRVVYDCGTFADRKTVGADLFAPLAHRDVDLLVISHFHWDHISRIPDLIGVAGKVKEVWIPYLSPDERLLFAIATAMGGAAAGEAPGHVAEITRIAHEGRAWFEARGIAVREIGGEPPPEGPEGEEPPGGGDAPDNENPCDSRPPEELTVSPPLPIHGALHHSSSFRAYQSQLNARASSGDPTAEAPVRLLTWVRPLDPQLAWHLSHGLLTVVGAKDRNDVHAIVQAVEESVSRVELRKLYQSIHSDLNSSSLFLLAQPAHAAGRPAAVFTAGALPAWRLPSPLQPAFVWTGDATRDVLEEFVRDAGPALREPLERALVHQVPHHGAAACLSLGWIGLVGRNWPGFSVISAGRSNRFQHPSPEAVWRYRATVVSEGGVPFAASFTWR